MTLLEPRTRRRAWPLIALLAAQVLVVGGYVFGAAIPWLRLHGFTADPGCGLECPSTGSDPLAGLAFYATWFQPLTGLVLAGLGAAASWRTRRPLRIALIAGTVASALYALAFFTDLGAAIHSWVLD
jgi:hypothetical protein